MMTIDLLALENVTGGAKRLPKLPKKAPALPSPVVPWGSSFCARNPFACSNMATGGNI